MSAINTKTARRRLVAFTTLECLWKDLDKIEGSHKGGALKRLGNHDAGPICHHLSLAMKGSFDGFPKLGSLWIRLIGPPLKKRVLSQPFKPGLRLRSEDQKLAWDDSVAFEAGLANLRGQIERVVRGAKNGDRPGAPHPFLGKMTAEDWNVYYLRHAELHLSFLQP